MILYGLFERRCLMPRSVRFALLSRSANAATEPRNAVRGIVAVTDRGTLTDNRGILHNDAGAVRRAWQLRRWILCILEFTSRKRAVMQPGRYTELFFLDEATGLAVGRAPSASGGGSARSGPHGSRAARM